MEHWRNLSIENITEMINGQLIIEQWLPIKGYEGLYEISNFGRVKKVLRDTPNPAQKVRQKITKQIIMKTGYLQVTLNKLSKPHTFLVHRICAKAFLLNPQNKPQVNHKNGIKTDNRISKLEWNTREENAQHSYRVLGNRHNLANFKNRHGKRKSVFCVTTGDTFISIKEAAAALGIPPRDGSIARVCNGEERDRNGFVFNFV